MTAQITIIIIANAGMFLIGYSWAKHNKKSIAKQHNVVAAALYNVDKSIRDHHVAMRVLQAMSDYGTMSIVHFRGKYPEYISNSRVEIVADLAAKSSEIISEYCTKGKQ